MAKLLSRLPALLLLFLCLSSAQNASADARFDLAGPKIDVRVTRNGVTLPIALVPNLQPGDQIWLHPDLPTTQSVHYLLIAVFLRGTTNPPPDNWFVRIETWNKKVREEGAFITVPDEAQQAVLFLAPETGGDFSTLRSAVKGRPGIFVRASQDLTEAGFEQARIEKYLAEMKQVAPGDPAALTEHSNLLARTLNLKPNPECFKRPIDQQFNCLTQTGNQSLLDDGHGQTVVASLSNGPGSDFINQASYTQLAGAGTYSAYVGAVVDLIRLTSSLHTAQYQYIPAIAFPDQSSLNLRLNTPPSFHNPKSVIVIGLPAVQKSTLPPLRPAEPNHTSCLLDPKMVLPIDGAPLVFSTSFAHQMVLHLNLPAGTAAPNGQPDVPLSPDAFQGGLTISQSTPGRRELPDAGTAPTPTRSDAPQPPKSTASLPVPTQPITGTVKGLWGFDSFIGPTLVLQATPGGNWHIVRSPSTPENLIAGQPNHLQIASSGTACIQSMQLEPGDQKIDWKVDEKADLPDHSEAHAATPTPETPSAKDVAVPPRAPVDSKPVTAEVKPAQPLPPPQPAVHPVDLTLNLQHAATPGSIQLAIQQFGQVKADQLGTKTFSEPAKIEAMQFHNGDSTVQLTGHGLDEVKQLTIKDAIFIPQAPAAADPDQPAPKPTSAALTLELAKDAKSPQVKNGEHLSAQVQLQDGRTVDVSTDALPPRPAVSILSRRITQATPSPIQLSSPDEVPLGSQLVFFLKSKAKFDRSEQIEISNADATLQTKLSIKENSLVLQDSHTILATLDPLKTFGPSSFGPFRIRAVAQDGTVGDWLPLATIVRLPTLSQLQCTGTHSQEPNASCLLTGQSLYLIDSIADSIAFTDPTTVPEGFVDTTLAIPHLTSPTFYLRLRDDPTAIQQVTLAMTPPPAPAHPTTTHASAVHPAALPPATQPAPTPQPAPQP
ncbi:hypothetical protein [Granulicella tundricola]|uniref:Uncharacterized protein n=1 Tax=Granulicella tundricola (strain ATCC BAA-1859 / DSM 23138 / MP5ACTX9) TaxID=1198114 RepID=E8X034_GRATM|nr:hypothetical protein [Granulicella tundricola]ADW68930.1 hypothetical protein AciX9_1884 [Granulicella tundricola MP5ACTX9]